MATSILVSTSTSIASLVNGHGRIPCQVGVEVLLENLPPSFDAGLVDVIIGLLVSGPSLADMWENAGCIIDGKFRWVMILMMPILWFRRFILCCVRVRVNGISEAAHVIACRRNTITSIGFVVVAAFG